MDKISLKEKFKKILIFSQKYTKTDMVYIFKGGIWLSAQKIIQSLSSLVLSIFFANFLLPEEYGIYKYVISIAGTVTAFSLTGLGTSVSQAAAKEKQNSLKFSFWLEIRYSVILTFLSLLTSIYYYINGNKTLAISLVAIAVFQPLLNASRHYIPVLEGLQKFKLLAKLQTFFSIFFSLITIIVLLLSSQPIYIIISYFVSNAILLITQFLYINKKFPEQIKLKAENITFAKHLSLMNILSTCFQYIDKILIFHFLGAVQLAIYSFATVPVEQIHQLIKFNITKLAFPKLVNMRGEDTRDNLEKKVLRLTIFIIPVIILYLLIIPIFYKYIMPQYIQSVPYSMIYALVIIFIPRSLYMESMNARLKHRELYKINIITSIMKILFIIILLPFLQIMGVVIAILLTRLFSYILLKYYFNKSLL